MTKKNTPLSPADEEIGISPAISHHLLREWSNNYQYIS